MTVTDSIIYVGVNDHNIDLFEGQFVVPLGMAYNSYVILDDKIAVMDTIEEHFADEWLNNIEKAVGDRKPDYLVVQHMEPDHSANIVTFMEKYPDTVIVSSMQAFRMMKNFFGTDFADKRIVVSEGKTLSLGKHTLNFVGAPMVHWPEVLMTYESTEKVLFSADGFGKFGANDVEDPEGWACEAARYYFGIVGKWGDPVQAVLEKAAGLDISIICPLHGPVLTENLGYYINLYNLWSSYTPEFDGVFIAYTSVYGHTKAAAMLLKNRLENMGCKVAISDLARSDLHENVENAFRYGKIVLATTTYNGDIYPAMRNFIENLTERNYQNRTIGLIENGSWFPKAKQIMTSLFAECDNITFTKNSVKVMSALNADSIKQVTALAEELA